MSRDAWAEATQLRPLKCARPGCADRYDEHAPGGGACLVWYPDDGGHCDCRGFQWVALETTVQRPGGRS